MAEEVRYSSNTHFMKCQIILSGMETGLPSAPFLCRIKTEHSTDNLPTDMTCPVQVKQESDLNLPQTEYLPCPQFIDIKEETTEMNEFIKQEQHDDLSLARCSEASCRHGEPLPHGLIPPVEMEDDECEVECAEKFSFLNKKRTAVNVKLSVSNTDQRLTRKQGKVRKRTDYHCVAGREHRTLLQTNADMQEAFWCETCGKNFKRSDRLSDHRRGHNRKRPYGCEQCGMMFAKPAYLKIHLRRHAGERAFSCDQCDKKFFDKYDLGVHQRDHTGERPYVCRECGKSFKRIYILNRHKKTHSDEKPFQCKVCGKTYKYVYSYRLHMKNHST